MTEVALRVQQFKRQRKDRLDLSGLGLNVIPQDVFTLEGLKELDLSNNKINTIDSSISQASNLEELNLENNAIKTLPDSLIKLKGLSALRLKGNPLTDAFKPLLNVGNASGLSTTLSACFKKHKESHSDSLFDDWDEHQEVAYVGLKTKSHPGNSQPTIASKPTPVVTKKAADDFDDFFADSTPSKSDKIPSVSRVTSNTTRPGTVQTTTTSRSQHPTGKGDFDMDGLMNTIDLSKSKYSSSDADDEIRIEEVNMGTQISTGGFSIVYKGSFRGADVAVKKVFDPRVTDHKLRDEFENEIKMLTRLRHPNIVIMMGYNMTPPNMFIIFELLAKGSLYSLLHQQKTSLSSQIKLRIAVQVANAINYLHQSRVVHRDIKSLNVLLDENYTVRLCDFGLAHMNRGEGASAGTWNYISPEQVEQRGYDQKVDVFAFGTMLYEMFAEMVPFDGYEPADIKKALLSGRELTVPTSAPKGIAELVKECRSLNPGDRPDFSSIVQRLLKCQP